MKSNFYYKLYLVIVLIISLYLSYKTLKIYQGIKSKPKTKPKSTPKTNKIFYTTQDFPQLKILEDNWDIISKELPAFDIHKKYSRRKPYWLNNKSKSKLKYLRKIKSKWYEGWQGDCVWYNFPLMIYNDTIGNAAEFCPNTIKILKSLKCKRIVGFSILVPNSRLYKHNDPVGKKYGSMAGNLLITPNKNAKLLLDSSNSLNKNKYTHSYTHSLGKMVIFDSTTLHTATNNDSDIRAILYIDFDTKL